MSSTSADKGYGNALRGGIEASHGEYVLMADADDSYDFRHIPRFVEELRAGADLVMGNRFRGGIADGAMPFLHRYLGNPVLTAVGKLFFQVSVQRLSLRHSRFPQRRVRAHGHAIHRHGVRQRNGGESRAVPHDGARSPHHPLAPDGRSRAPHLRTWRDGWRHLRFLLMYSPRWVFLFPGILLILLGLAGVTFFFPARAW